LPRPDTEPYDLMVAILRWEERQLESVHDALPSAWMGTGPGCEAFAA
jgi:hypothetical protein